MVVLKTMAEKLWGQVKGRAAGRRECSSNRHSATELTSWQVSQSCVTWATVEDEVYLPWMNKSTHASISICQKTCRLTEGTTLSVNLPVRLNKPSVKTVFPLHIMLSFTHKSLLFFLSNIGKASFSFFKWKLSENSLRKQSRTVHPFSFDSCGSSLAASCIGT